VISGVQLGFLFEPLVGGVLSVSADGEPLPFGSFAPFNVIGALGMLFFLTVDDNDSESWRYCPVVYAGNGRVKADFVLDGLNSLGEIALLVRH